MRSETLVLIVDDDLSVRESLPDLLKAFGHRAKAFASAEEFLSAGGDVKARCLILDIGLPGMSGPELQRELVRQGHNIPTIFITGRSEQSIPPGLLRKLRGAVLFKPFNEKELRAALDAALRTE